MRILLVDGTEYELTNAGQADPYQIEEDYLSLLACVPEGERDTLIRLYSAVKHYQAVMLTLAYNNDDMILAAIPDDLLRTPLAIIPDGQHIRRLGNVTLH